MNEEAKGRGLLCGGKIGVVDARSLVKAELESLLKRKEWFGRFESGKLGET